MTLQSSEERLKGITWDRKTMCVYVTDRRLVPTKDLLPHVHEIIFISKDKRDCVL